MWHCLPLEASQLSARQEKLDIVKNLMVQYLVDGNTPLLDEVKPKYKVHIRATYFFRLILLFNYLSIYSRNQ
jgi:hypothetical protein